MLNSSGPILQLSKGIGLPVVVVVVVVVVGGGYLC
jgi:hypothetical protein